MHSPASKVTHQLETIQVSGKEASNSPITTTRRWVSVKRMPEIYPETVKESTIRWLVFNEHQNGFHQCVRRIGGKVLIDLDAFEAWVDSGETARKPLSHSQSKW
ncbi:MAG: hypothetical protein NTV32_05415 [Gammaproteobacteria bacterium]|nr:hypothetical protein [Gammaproteobacteria bacterium]